MIDQVYRHTGQKDTVLFADAHHGAGLPPRVQGRHLLRQGRHDHPRCQEQDGRGPKELVADYEQQYQDGLITQQEKYNKVIDAWSRCGDQVADAMMDEIKAQPIGEDGKQAQINSIYMMSHSGARGSPRR